MSKGTWGRRVWGEVQKGRSHTLFHLQITLENGCDFFEKKLISNAVLDQYPKAYNHTLNELTERLSNRVDQRLL